MNDSSVYVIISAEKHASASKDQQKTMELRGRLANENLKCQPVNTAYNHHKEHSFLVDITDNPALYFGHIFTLEELGRRFQQESILLVEPNKTATLIYCDIHSRKTLGAFTQVKEAEATSKGAYTEIDGIFYIVK